MSKKKLTLIEKIAKFLNEREALKDIEIGIVGQDLAIVHDKETEEEANDKRKVVMKEFVKMGLGYKIVLANFSKKKFLSLSLNLITKAVRKCLK